MTENLLTLLSDSQLDLLHRVADESSALRFPVYLVGGSVRDLVLGRAVLDFDLVLEGDAISLGRSLVSKFSGKLTVHQKFGTAKWFLDARKIQSENLPTFVDLISARSETYKHPAALPTVKMGTIADDIRRRDFTLNALAVRLDGEHFGELRDELGGMADLQNGLVRILHPRSFVDDPTRIFRAVRYEKRYGFKIEPQTLALIPEARPLIAKLSAQRVRHELDLILDEPNAESMLARLGDLGLLKPIHPTLTWDVTTWARLQHKVNSAEACWLLWLMSLTEIEITSLNERLKFTSSLLKSLYASSKIFAALSTFADLKPSQCVERLDNLPLTAISVVTLVAQGQSRQMLEKYLSEWRHVKPKTTGGDLKNLGVVPGPRYQEILSGLRAAWLDGKVSSENEEKRLLENYLKDTK